MIERMNVASGSSNGCHVASDGTARDDVSVISHRVLLSASELSGGLEVHAKEGELRFFIFADVLDRVDVEGHRITVDRQYDRLRFTVYVNLMKRVRGYKRFPEQMAS